MPLGPPGFFGPWLSPRGPPLFGRGAPADGRLPWPLPGWNAGPAGRFAGRGPWKAGLPLFGPWPCLQLQGTGAGLWWSHTQQCDGEAGGAGSTKLTLTFLGPRAASRAESLANTLPTANTERARLKTNNFLIVVIFKGLYTCLLLFLVQSYNPKSVLLLDSRRNAQCGRRNAF